MAALVTLTTDFGTRDAWVAAMKGVLWGVARAAGREIHVVDVTHEIAPHAVAEAALALEAAAPWFPQGTIHLAVVDPGVGTARRGLVVAAAGQLFVGPDNGLFTAAFANADWRAWALEAPEYRLPAVSRTFHGRDVFAPAAAHLALGLEADRLGRAVVDPVRLRWPAAEATEDCVSGVVVHVDRFGNLVTSIPAGVVAALGPGARVRVAGRVLPLVGTYADLPAGRAGALIGSGGRLEIAVDRRRAANLLAARRGTPVVVSRPSSTTERRRASSTAPTTGRASRRR